MAGRTRRGAPESRYRHGQGKTFRADRDLRGRLRRRGPRDPQLEDRRRAVPARRRGQYRAQPRDRGELFDEGVGRRRGCALCGFRGRREPRHVGTLRELRLHCAPFAPVAARQLRGRRLRHEQIRRHPLQERRRNHLDGQLSVAGPERRTADVPGRRAGRKPRAFAAGGLRGLLREHRARQLFGRVHRLAHRRHRGLQHARKDQVLHQPRRDRLRGARRRGGQRPLLSGDGGRHLRHGQGRRDVLRQFRGRHHARLCVQPHGRHLRFGPRVADRRRLRQFRTRHLDEFLSGFRRRHRRTVGASRRRFALPQQGGRAVRRRERGPPFDRRGYRGRHLCQERCRLRRFGPRLPQRRRCLLRTGREHAQQRARHPGGRHRGLRQRQ